MGQLLDSHRDFHSNCWANLRILGQPCELQVDSRKPPQGTKVGRRVHRRAQHEAKAAFDEANAAYKATATKAKHGPVPPTAVTRP